MSGVVPRTGEVSMSCINRVRLCRTNQQGRIVENPNTYFSGSQNFYRNQAAMRGFVGNDEGLKLSEFRAAQIITACIRSFPETNGGVYGTLNDGRIQACIRPDTINTDGGGNRYYGYRLGGTGAFEVCANNNFKTWFGLEGGGTGAGGTPSGGSRTYYVELKDMTLGANVRRDVVVTYAGGERLYGCLQRKDNLSV